MLYEEMGLQTKHARIQRIFSSGGGGGIPPEDKEGYHKVYHFKTHTLGIRCAIVTSVVCLTVTVHAPVVSQVISAPNADKCPGFPPLLDSQCLRSRNAKIDVYLQNMRFHSGLGNGWAA